MKKIWLWALISQCLIGAGVSAQQNGGQSSFVFQMQAMQQEVAQLRDMIERQQYRINQLERQLSSTNPVEQGAANYGASDTRRVNPQSYQNNGNEARQAVNPQANPYNNSSQRNQSQTGNNAVVGALPNTVVGQTNQGSNTLPERSVLNQTTDVGNSQFETPADLNRQQPPQSSTTQRYNPSGEYSPSEEENLLNQGSRMQIEERVIERLSGQQREVIGTPVEERIVGGVSARDNRPNIESVPGGQYSTTQPQETANVELQVEPVTGPGSVAPQSTFDNPRSANSGLEIALEEGEADLYQRAFDSLRNSKHEEANALFKEQIKRFPQGEYVDDAHYWIAESNYVNRSLDEAKTHYQAIIENHSDSQRLPDALLKSAYLEQEQGNMDQARLLLLKVVDDHPSSDAAISAKNRLALLN